MSRELTALEIVDALARDGYFQVADFDPARFNRIVEDRLGVGTPRALDVLAASNLTTFEYTTDPRVHPRDVIDSWRVSLTAAGAALLSDRGKLAEQTSNPSLERP